MAAFLTFLQVFPLVTYFRETEIPSGYLAKLGVYNYEVGLFSSAPLKKYTHGLESPQLSLFRTPPPFLFILNLRILK